MDNKKKEELLQKRLKLKEEIRLKSLRDRIDYQLTYLEKISDQIIIYYDHEHLHWISNNVKIRSKDGYTGLHKDFQIDVDDKSCLVETICNEKFLLSDEFSAELFKIIPIDARLTVCSDGGDPEIDISTKAFIGNPLLFIQKPEVWILSNDKKWIIEYISDQSTLRIINIENSTPILIWKINIQ